MRTGFLTLTCRAVAGLVPEIADRSRVRGEGNVPRWKGNPEAGIWLGKG